MLEILHDVRNQDTESRSAVVAGVEGNFAWLMGGDPTPVSDTDNDEVAAFTAHLNDSLHGLAAIASDEVDLRQLLSEAVVQATWRIEPRDPFDVWSFPRTSMVLANVTGREVRLIQVGDVAWGVSDDEGVVAESESEPAFAELYQRTRGESRALRAKANEEEDGYPLVQAGKPGPLPVSVTSVRAFRPEVVLIAGDWPWSREGVAPARLRVQSDD